ncbi:hypothetical protein GTA08_BOTSDO09653 [Neofusicoccum parvum]|nr:hypothetical protein GTA08_BOTSDO09653 [Neofusicoccum parvum]
MHASTILAALLAGLAMATPIANNDETVKVVKRSNSCTNDFGVVYATWSIYLDNDATYNKQCGGGCLDNIRGRCGDVTDWGCTRDSAGTAHYTFNTVSGCTNYDMTQALHACSKQTIDCSTNGSS